MHVVEMAKLIIGLGNPIEKFIHTKHNVGQILIDIYKNIFKFPNYEKINNPIGDNGHKEKHEGIDKTDYALCSFKPEYDMILFKSLTFMNETGRAVSFVINKYNININDILVVHDDVYTDLGIVKFKNKGKHDGGHNGIKDITNSLNTPCFSRLKIGISMPKEDIDLYDYVLSEFSNIELSDIKYIGEKYFPNMLADWCENKDKASSNWNGINLLRNK
jgi:PTH1 family peptidyl-tRNA hydrolase